MSHERCDKFIDSISYCVTRGDYKSTHWKKTPAFEVVLERQDMIIAQTQ